MQNSRRKGFKMFFTVILIFVDRLNEKLET